MAVFQYTALDAVGKTQKGVIEGDNARHVRQQLRERNLTPTAIAETDERSRSDSPKAAKGGRGRLSLADLSLITRQMATLIGAGTPLAESLQMVASQAEKPRVRAIILGVRSTLLEGYSLADSLAAYPAAFGQMYRATVDAGEQTGKLDKVLERLADYVEDQQAVAGTVSKALVYPILLVIVCIGIVVGLLVFAVPSVVSIFDDQGRELPGITQTLIAMSDFAQNWWFASLLGVISSWVVWRQLLKLESVAYAYDAWKLRVPLVRKLIRTGNTAQFSRTLAILVNSGVPLLQAISVAAQVVTNRPMQTTVAHAAAKVREGGTLAKSLNQSGQFQPLLIHMIASGEASGELGPMLQKAAEQQDRELHNYVGTLTSLLNPIVLLIMASIVLFIVFAMMLPILQMSNFA
ncbi:MAG: type II secretion system inner membrane protein GspF [Gammaproteobacteria bacterium]|nr:type II secretion system inner membrane protein GspF [Gammaproteobacteria bacterium]